MTRIFFVFFSSLLLVGCVAKNDSADLADCRDIAMKNETQKAKSVGSTYALCADARERKRHSEEREESVVQVASFILDLFSNNDRN